MAAPSTLPTDLPADLADAVRAYLDRAGVPRGARALVLGANAGPWADLLVAHEFEVVVQEDSVARFPRGEPVQLVLAIDLLAQVTWDRWALQQAHAALADDGRLLLAVPNALALGSPAHLRRLGSRVLGLPGAAEGERRYRLATVLASLETLGFAVEHASAHGLGWLAPVAAMAPGLAHAAADLHLLSCTRRPSIFGADARRPYPDPETHRRRYEARHRRRVEERDRWRARHPRPGGVPVEILHPSRHRGARVLVLAPHPDDEIIGCGGTLAQLIAHGASVTVVHATDGSATAGLAHESPTVRGSIRLEEARAVGALMGFTSLELWAEDDATFGERDDLVDRLRATIDALRPGVIFTPFVTDDHPAHRAVCRILARALRRLPPAACDDTRVLAYEIWNLIPATVQCVITDVVALQEQALLCYATAMRAEDYVHACQDRNYYNAWVVGGFRGFAEVFVEIAARDFPDFMTGAVP